jgi:hypothetical protein
MAEKFLIAEILCKIIKKVTRHQLNGRRLAGGWGQSVGHHYKQSTQNF